MATVSQYLEKAASYIGVSGTDNIFNTWYWGFHCYDPDTYPWCACFQSYVGVHDLGMPFKASASAAGVGWQGTPVADEDVQPGDWVLFTWDGRQDFGWADHIGVVEWSDINSSGYFGTIEGNTGYGEGTVARCTRYNWGSYGTKFFRPPYDGSPSPEPSSSAEWQGEVVGLSDTTGAGDDYAGVFGKPMLYLAVEGAGEYQAHTLNGEWLPKVSRYDLDDEEYGMAGEGLPIDAVRITDPSVRYQTHNEGGDWNDVMHGTLDTGGSTDDFAGEYGTAQDAIRIWREGGEQPRYNVFS